MLKKLVQSLCVYIGLSLFLFLIQTLPVRAEGLALSKLDVAVLADSKIQIQLELSGTVTAPKVFHTDNPSRVALDFAGVKSTLGKKVYPVNQGAINSIYIAEATNKVRVVVNLLESMPFETKVLGNKVLLTFTRKSSIVPTARSTIQGPAVASAPSPVAHSPGAAASRTMTPSPYKASMPSSYSPKPLSSIPSKSTRSVIPNLMPEQGIRGFDFKRGDKGEGRLLVSLANPNTIVNTKEQAGKVILSFVNTHLPDNLAKKLDVSEFATPVKTIEAVPSTKDTTVTVALQNTLYDYSLYQSEGLLTVEFRPLSSAEKEALENSRVKYTGDRLSLNFQEIDLRSVIAILAEFTGQNVVAGDDVTGKITLKLDDVPWDEALDFIMMTKDLGKFETGNVTLISPLDKIKTYKQKQQATQQVVEQLDPLITEYIAINYAKADNYKKLLYGGDTGQFGSCTTGSASSSTLTTAATASSSPSTSTPTPSSGSGSGSSTGGAANQQDSDRFGLISPRGSVVVDGRTNTLIVRETAKRLEEIKKLLNKLDVPVRQVMIESRLVIATSTFARNLGVKFGGNDRGRAGSGKVFGIGSITEKTNTAIPEAPIPPSTVSTDTFKNLVDLGLTTTPYGVLGLTLARGADYVLNLELQAQQDQGLAEMLSNPRVMTSDRCKAIIRQGVQIPFTSATAGTGGVGLVTFTTVFIDAVLQLEVLPQITPSGSVIMDLKITRNTPGRNAVNGITGIDKRELDTNVHVNDGETVVLGGVFEENKSHSTSKIPFFGDLPGIGFMFQRNVNQDDKSELLIFITPKIIEDHEASN